jgi:hypothetical protein
VFLILIGILIGIGYVGRLAVGITALVRQTAGGIWNWDTAADGTDFSCRAEEVSELRLEAGVGSLCVETWDQDTISVSYPKDCFRIEQDGTKLSVLNRSNSLFRRIFSFPWQEEAQIVVKLPEGKEFQAVYLETGAGEAQIEALTAGEITIETGAGSLVAEKLTAQTGIFVDAGVGETTIQDLTAGEAVFQVGVGELYVNGRVNGDISVDCGVGDMTLELENREEEFHYSVDCGIGSVTLDGVAYSTRLGNSRMEF